MPLNSELQLINYWLSSPRLQIIFLLLGIWSLAWKGVALWKSAKNSQKNWFIVMLILNTVGILEIIYIFYFSKRKASKIKNIDADGPKVN